jgi:hypothetical protein
MKNAPRPRTHLAFAAALALAFVCLAAPAALHASLGGDCKLLSPEFGNPGLGCNGVGDSCTIGGKSGTCTNMKRKISSLIYCVCSPGGDVPEEVEAKATALPVGELAATCGSTTTFEIDTSAPHTVDIALPRSMGGQVVRAETFSGSFTVTTTAIADDPSHCLISIDSGEFSAGSVHLPDGRDTGVTTYRFGASDASTGVLDLSTGRFTASAQGRIANDLYPDLVTDGTYRGTVDFAAGTITLDTTTVDRTGSESVPAPAPPHTGL